VGHHLLLSHARAIPRLRAASPGSLVGITLNFSTSRAASETQEDRRAADLHDQYVNRWFLDPLFGRGYPAELTDIFGARFATPKDAELREIATPIDFLGVNYYSPTFLRPGGELGFEAESEAQLRARGYELTTMGWPVAPDAFYELLTRIGRDYRPPMIYITENGAAFEDTPTGGRIADLRRQAYLETHLSAVQRAIGDNVPVQGYFVWSLMDNFEWGHGYSQRFGLIYVDYPTQARLMKDSAFWYAQVLRDNSLPTA
jgi:beta-glucosidase